MNESLKGELLSGVFFSAISRYSGVVINIIISAILSRLLSPSDFGVVAIAMVFIIFFSILSELGIGPAIIQQKELKKEDISNIFSFTVYLGLLLAFVFFLASNDIARYYGREQLVIILRILSVNIFFSTINIVPNALLLKNKKFKIIAIRSLVIQIIGGLLAIYAALNNIGVYSLLIIPLISSSGFFFVNYSLTKPEFSPWLRMESLKKIFSYSFFQFMFNFINYFSRNFDKLIIGRMLGVNQLGYYDKAYSLMMQPMVYITHVLTPVMHPVLSNFQKDLNSLTISYLKIIKILAFIGFPISALLYFSSREIIILIFGYQWINSIIIFKILSLSIGIQIIAASSGAIFQASNATKQLFISGLLSSILIILSIILVIHKYQNIQSVAYCIVITFCLNFFQSNYILFNNVLKSKLKDVLKIYRSPLVCTLCVVVNLAIIDSVLTMNSLIFLFITKTSITSIVCFGYFLLRNEFNIRNYLKYGKGL